MKQEKELEIKNLKYNEQGNIDVEMNHPVYGWIPFTASPDDVEPHGRIIYKKAKAGEYGVVEAYIKNNKL